MNCRRLFSGNGQYKEEQSAADQEDNQDTQNPPGSGPLADFFEQRGGGDGGVDPLAAIDCICRQRGADSDQCGPDDGREFAEDIIEAENSPERFLSGINLPKVLRESA